MSDWLWFLAGMAAVIWPVPLLYWFGYSWARQREHERLERALDTPTRKTPPGRYTNG